MGVGLYNGLRAVGVGQTWRSPYAGDRHAPRPTPLACLTAPGGVYYSAGSVAFDRTSPLSVCDFCPCFCSDFSGSDTASPGLALPMTLLGGGCDEHVMSLRGPRCAARGPCMWLADLLR